MRASSPSALIATLALGLMSAGCDRQSGNASQAAGTAPPASVPPPAAPSTGGKIDRSQKGAAMPAEGFAMPDGTPTTLAAFKGKPVLVNLWATWCAPCVKEMPALDRLAARTKGRLRVLTINEDLAAQGGPDPVDAWWAKAGLKSLDRYRDPKNDLLFAYGGGQLPTTVLYDATGREVWRVTGEIDWDGAAADRLIAEATT